MFGGRESSRMSHSPLAMAIVCMHRMSVTCRETWHTRISHSSLVLSVCPSPSNKQQWMCHTVALPFALKMILMQRKNYENSNILPCKNIIFQKSSKTNQNPSIYYYSITNLKFQHKPKYQLSKVLI